MVSGRLQLTQTMCIRPEWSARLKHARSGKGQHRLARHNVTDGRVAQELPFPRAAAERQEIAVCGRLSFGKGFLEALHRWSVRPCVRPVGAVRMTAGHNAFREDGSRPKTRARSASAIVGFPVFRFRPAVALLHVRPSQARSSQRCARPNSTRRSARDIVRRRS